MPKDFSTPEPATTESATTESATTESSTQADARNGSAPQTTPPAHASRRAFLARAVAAATATALAACGRSRPSPSPLATPTATQIARSSLLPTPSSAEQVYLPMVAHDEISLIPEPTLTPTPPKATDTPRPPTATPTPVATPFPPGPPSKLGLHIERNIPEIFRLLETGAVSVVTTLEVDANLAVEIKRISPRTKLIGRINMAQAELRSMRDPAGEARAFVEKLLPIANEPRRKASFDGWISFNEPVAGNADEMARLAEFESERTRLLAESGIRSVIGNFGTGQPPLELWQHFLPAIQTAQQTGGWLGLHEYSAPTIYYLTTRENQGRYPGVSPQDTGWLTLRYRQVYNQILRPAGLEIPLVFTELGVDGLVAERPGPRDARGWQDFQSYWAENGYGLWGPGAYIEQLAWYDEAMRQDAYVLGGCIYALGTSQQWLSYDISGATMGVLEQYLAVHTP